MGYLLTAYCMCVDVISAYVTGRHKTVFACPHSLHLCQFMNELYDFLDFSALTLAYTSLCKMAFFNTIISMQLNQNKILVCMTECLHEEFTSRCSAGKIA